MSHNEKTGSWLGLDFKLRICNQIFPCPMGVVTSGGWGVG